MAVEVAVDGAVGGGRESGGVFICVFMFVRMCILPVCAVLFLIDCVYSSFSLLPITGDRETRPALMPG